MSTGRIPSKSPAPKMDSIGGVAGDPKATQSTTPPSEQGGAIGQTPPTAVKAQLPELPGTRDIGTA